MAPSVTAPAAARFEARRERRQRRRTAPRNATTSGSQRTDVTSRGIIGIEGGRWRRPDRHRSMSVLITAMSGQRFSARRASAPPSDDGGRPRHGRADRADPACSIGVTGTNVASCGTDAAAVTAGFPHPIPNTSRCRAERRRSVKSSPMYNATSSPAPTSALQGEIDPPRQHCRGDEMLSSRSRIDRRRRASPAVGRRRHGWGRHGLSPTR